LYAGTKRLVEKRYAATADEREQGKEGGREGECREEERERSKRKTAREGKQALGLYAGLDRNRGRQDVSE